MNHDAEKEKTASQKHVHAYDRMLQRAEQALASTTERSEATLEHALDTARKRAIELGELTQDEADRIHGFVTRDLYDVGQHQATEEREVADWLRLGVLLVEKDVLNRFTRLAETAKVEFKHLQKAGNKLDEWHTGEVTTIGSLRCQRCGEVLRFDRTESIPACPKCQATVFERIRE